MRVLKRAGALRLDAWQEIIVKNRKVTVPVIGGIVVFLILFFIILAPARKELADKKKRWHELEAQLISSRKRLEDFKVDKTAVEAKVEELRRLLPSKSPTPAILEELTKKGRHLGIDFISITPQPAEPNEQLQQYLSAAFKCKVLPININMKATYKSLGEYLGQIEGLESSFATVNGFQAAKDDKLFPKLAVNMEIYTYVLEEAGNGQK